MENGKAETDKPNLRRNPPPKSNKLNDIFTKIASKLKIAAAEREYNKFQFPLCRLNGERLRMGELNALARGEMGDFILSNKKCHGSFRLFIEHSEKGNSMW